jgi:uncharacterized protein (DUF1499 family)
VFDQIYARKYQQIEIYLFTLEEHQTIKIHDMEFEFEDKVEIIKVNNTMRLTQEPRLFIVADNTELVTEGFSDLIDVHQNSIKIYLHRVFKKKDEDIGKTIELTLRINYSLDGGEVMTQETKYLVSIVKDIVVARSVKK